MTMHGELYMLATLMTQNNAPPDLIGALRLVFPTTEVMKVGESSISIIDKEFVSRPNVNPLDKPVSISGFEGTLETLLDSLRNQGIKIAHQPAAIGVEVGEAPTKSKKDNLRVKMTKFTGTVRGLLTKVLSDISGTASYLARIDSKDAISLDVFCVFVD